MSAAQTTQQEISEKTTSAAPPVSLDQAHELLSSEGSTEEARRAHINNYLLDLLPRVIDDLCTGPSRDPPIRQARARVVLEELLKQGSPKELCMSTENQLKVAADEVAQCFLLEEDPEIHQETDQEHGEPLEGSSDQKTLKNVCNRVVVVLEVHARVVCRLEYKKSKAGVIMVRNFVERLDHFLGELMQALYAGESLAAELVRGLLVAVAVWCRAVTTWIQQLKPSEIESKDLRIKLADLLLKYLVLLHSRLGLKLLDKGFQALNPKAMLSHQAGQVDDEEDAESLITCKKAVTESLAGLGLVPEGHSEWMIGIKRNNPDGKHIYYPTAALILTTWHLVDWLSAEEEESDPVIRPLQGHADLLEISLPILGSALNGIAKDAGHMWTWYVAHQMQVYGFSADIDDVSMLLELIMPNMANEPSDTDRFALHRLLGLLISLVGTPKDRITLYEQLLSPENPFSAVRLSSLALLREEIASDKSRARSLPSDDAFWTTLAPIFFTIPVLDVPLETVALDMALDDLMIPWSTECAKILLLLLSDSAGGEQRAKKHGEEKRLSATWIAPLKEAVGRWEDEVPNAEDPDVLEASMLLYSLKWTLEQVEGKIAPSAQ